MAWTTTTLGAAVGANDIQLKVAATTDFVKGRWIKIDNEILQQNGDVDGLFVPVRRGQNGTQVATHPSGANCYVAVEASDLTGPVGQLAEATSASNQWRLPVYSYTASGAISATPGIHVLNGTNALTMTLTDPTAEMDGQLLVIAGNGKAAHTVSLNAASSSFGDAGSDNDVATFGTGGRQVFVCMALNLKWCPFSLLAGANIADLTVTLG